jgi:hypothetical protein
MNTALTTVGAICSTGAVFLVAVSLGNFILALLCMLAAGFLFASGFTGQDGQNWAVGNRRGPYKRPNARA